MHRALRFSPWEGRESAWDLIFRAFTAAQMKTAHIYLTRSCLLFRLLFNHLSVWFPCAHTFCLLLSVSVLNQSQRWVVSSLVLVLCEKHSLFQLKLLLLLAKLACFCLHGKRERDQQLAWGLSENAYYPWCLLSIFFFFFLLKWRTTMKSSLSAIKFVVVFQECVKDTAVTETTVRLRELVTGSIRAR